MRAALLVAAGAAGLVVAPATLAGASATFSAVTSNTADALATGQLQPPTALSATQTCTSTPTITHRTATGVGGTTSVSIPVPTGTTTGDVLVAQIAYRDSAETITAPGGWTLLFSTSSGTQVTSALYWKAATASETAPVFSRPAGAPGDMAGIMEAYTGARLTAPVVFNGVPGNSATATTPSVTTTGTTVEVVTILTKSQEALPLPAGTASLYSGTTNGGTASVGVMASDETFAGPGATTVRSSTSSTSFSSGWTAQTLVLRRVAGTPTANLGWTASSSTWATGYELTRAVGGSTQATQSVPGVATTSTTDGPLANATTYSYQLTTAKGTWRSSAATATLTTDC